eukprot:11193048-Lingulodinium_polyedra.AAC.1
MAGLAGLLLAPQAKQRLPRRARGRQNGSPGCRYGMSLTTSNWTTRSSGRMKYGFSLAGQIKVKPCCMHRIPTDRTLGVLSRM